MRAVVVVVVNEGIERGLGVGEIFEGSLVVEQLLLDGLVEALDLAGRGRGSNRVLRWVIAFILQMRSNSTSAGRGLPKRPVNCLPLSVKTSSGIP